MYDSTDELSERRRGSLGKVAGKTAHVSTLTFGALDMSKNDLPPELVAKLGPDPKRHEVRHTHPPIPCFPMWGLRSRTVLPAVFWPWVPAWGSLEPSRRGGENAQKTGKNGGGNGRDTVYKV